MLTRIAPSLEPIVQRDVRVLVGSETLLSSTPKNGDTLYLKFNSHEWIWKHDKWRGRPASLDHRTFKIVPNNVTGARTDRDYSNIDISGAPTPNFLNQTHERRRRIRVEFIGGI